MIGNDKLNVFLEIKKMSNFQKPYNTQVVLNLSSFWGLGQKGVVKKKLGLMTETHSNVYFNRISASLISQSLEKALG